MTKLRTFVVTGSRHVTITQECQFEVEARDRRHAVAKAKREAADGEVEWRDDARTATHGDDTWEARPV